MHLPRNVVCFFPASYIDTQQNNTLIASLACCSNWVSDALFSTMSWPRVHRLEVLGRARRTVVFTVLALSLERTAALLGDDPSSGNNWLLACGGTFSIWGVLGTETYLDVIACHTHLLFYWQQKEPGLALLRAYFWGIQVHLFMSSCESGSSPTLHQLSFHCRNGFTDCVLRPKQTQSQQMEQTTPAGDYCFAYKWVLYSDA